VFRLAQLNRDLLPTPASHAAKHQRKDIGSNHHEHLVCEDSAFDLFRMMSASVNGFVQWHHPPTASSFGRDFPSVAPKDVRTQILYRAILLRTLDMTDDLFQKVRRRIGLS
jgi:hypothetical protein